MTESAFEFKSIFQYSDLTSNEHIFSDNLNQNNNKRESGYTFIHNAIVIAFYILFLVTFPISAFFCIKRIQALQRCLVYRLGTRLPLRGPGLIIAFPLIDCIEIIDLSDYEFVLVDRKQQLLTSDGSIIESNGVMCRLNVTNAIRSSTQLKDAKFNVEQFVKLSFINMITSSHVEDIEMKTDLVIKLFEQNCNIYLNNWGYNCKLIDEPKFSVISRANPLNQIMSKVKGLFNSEQSSQPNSLFNNLMKLQTQPNNELTHSCDELNENHILSSLQSMANKYCNYVSHDLFIAILVEQIDLIEYFKFDRKSGNVSKIFEKPNKVHIELKAKAKQHLMQFCYNQDVNQVEITTNLL